jgi:hypothetical protein
MTARSGRWQFPAMRWQVQVRANMLTLFPFVAAVVIVNTAARRRIKADTMGKLASGAIRLIQHADQDRATKLRA